MTDRRKSYILLRMGQDTWTFVFRDDVRKKSIDRVETPKSCFPRVESWAEVVDVRRVVKPSRCVVEQCGSGRMESSEDCEEETKSDRVGRYA